MKKSIQTLTSKLEVSEDGKIKGGFTKIKGMGANLSGGGPQNSVCPNTGPCDPSINHTCAR